MGSLPNSSEAVIPAVVTTSVEIVYLASQLIIANWLRVNNITRFATVHTPAMVTVPLSITFGAMLCALRKDLINIISNMDLGMFFENEF